MDVGSIRSTKTGRINEPNADGRSLPAWVLHKGLLNQINSNQSDSIGNASLHYGLVLTLGTTFDQGQSGGSSLPCSQGRAVIVAEILSHDDRDCGLRVSDQ